MQPESNNQPPAPQQVYAPQPQQPAPQPMPTPTPPPAPAPPNPFNQPNPGQAPKQYDFIVNSGTPPPGPSFPGANLPLPAKIAGVAGVLLLLILVVNAVFGGGPNFSPFISVAQDQQEMVHLTSNATEQRDLNTTNLNFTFTAKGVLASNQAEIIAYLQKNGTKVNEKTLNLKVLTKTDEQLTAAASSATYNKVYQDVMNSKLDSYMSDLDRAYKQTEGKKGHALLVDQYKQAKLLKTQLNTTVK